MYPFKVPFKILTLINLSRWALYFWCFMVPEESNVSACDVGLRGSAPAEETLHLVSSASLNVGHTSLFRACCLMLSDGPWSSRPLLISSWSLPLHLPARCSCSAMFSVCFIAACCEGFTCRERRQSKLKCYNHCLTFCSSDHPGQQ